MSDDQGKKREIERDAEALAAGYYKLHRFGDTAAWFAACVKMAEELLALRTAAEGMEKALERYFNTLSDDCGDHCTNNCRECQARAALAAYRKAVGR